MFVNLSVMFINSKSNKSVNFKVKLNPSDTNHNSDNAVKDATCQYWYTQQQNLLTINQKKEAWRKFGSVGIIKKTQHKV